MIPRLAAPRLIELAGYYPIVAITGPRQSGKTTFVRATFPDKPYASLEDPDVRALAATDPRGFLAQYPDGAVIDEAQRVPDLFSYLQTRVDGDRRTGLFALTGSQQFGLMERITQSLAGRVGLLHLLPFAFDEIADAQPGGGLEDWLWRGFYPPLHDRAIPPHGGFSIECKSGCTVAGDWFAPLERFAALAGAPRRLLIYGGDADQPRTDTPVFGWRAIGRAMDLAFA